MKFPTDRPVKVVMLGAGGTGGYAGASDASPKTRRESLRTGLERRAHPKKRVSQYAGNRARASAFGRPPAQSRP